MRAGVEVIHPKDRQAWLRARQQDVTASTVGALWGVHEFLTTYELWASKTGRLPRQDQESDAMRRGRLLEPVAVQILREEHPDWQIDYSTAEQTYYRDPALRLGATPDVQVVCPRRGKGIVQIKSVEAGIFRRKWQDEDGTSEAPLWIALQAILEAHLTGAEWAAVMPLVIGFGIEAPLVDVPLEHMPAIIDQMAAKSAQFWEMVAEDREPVIDYARDADLIDRLYSVGDAREEVDLTGDDDLPLRLGHIAALRHRVRGDEKLIQAEEARIKAAMGTAEVAHIPGGRTITWKTLRRRNPDGSASVYRVLRLPRTA